MDEIKIDWAKVDAESSIYDDKDKELEYLCQLGSVWSINGRSVPSFVMGHIPILLMVKSPLMKGGPMSDDDALKALTILIYGKDCVSMLLAENHLGEPLFSSACVSVRDEIIGGIGADYTGVKNTLCNLFNASMRAFEFLGKGDDVESVKLDMDAKWFSWVVTECAKKMCDSVDHIMWFYPLGMSAFCFIDSQEDSGRRVERPTDDKKKMEEIRRQVDAQKAA